MNSTNRNSANHPARWLDPNKLLADLRQRIYPVEFRIAEVVDSLSEQRESETQAGDVQDEQLGCGLASVAVSLWDIRRKLLPIAEECTDKRMRLMLRRTEKAIDALAGLGVTIDDPVGRRYGEGSEGTMRPHFQPRAEYTIETVVETVSPVIYWNDQLVQRGEVFVAVPMAVNETVIEKTERTER